MQLGLFRAPAFSVQSHFLAPFLNDRVSRKELVERILVSLPEFNVY